MNRLKKAINNPFYRFLLLSGLFYIIWFVTYDLYLKPQGKLDDVLGNITAEAVV